MAVGTKIRKIFHMPGLHIQAEKEKCMLECMRVLKKGGILVTAYIPRFYVFQYVAIIITVYAGNNRFLAQAIM